jgi:hypothetical protein
MSPGQIRAATDWPRRIEFGRLEVAPQLSWPNVYLDSLRNEILRMQRPRLAEQRRTDSGRIATTERHEQRDFGPYGYHGSRVTTCSANPAGQV